YYPILNPKPISQWEGEFGGRYFPNSGRTKIELFNPFLPSLLVSRLTYTNTFSHSGEFFGRVEHLSGFFVKGYGGISPAINSGGLQDEDFPPLPGGYSSTNSDQ